MLVKEYTTFKHLYTQTVKQSKIYSYFNIKNLKNTHKIKLIYPRSKDREDWWEPVLRMLQDAFWAWLILDIKIILSC